MKDWGGHKGKFSKRLELILGKFAPGMVEVFGPTEGDVVVGLVADFFFGPIYAEGPLRIVI